MMLQAGALFSLNADAVEDLILAYFARDFEAVFTVLPLLISLPHLFIH